MIELRVTGLTPDELRAAAANRRYRGGVQVMCDGPERFTVEAKFDSWAEVVEFGNTMHDFEGA